MHAGMQGGGRASPHIRRRGGSRAAGGRRGFTLVEVLAVIVLLGILAALLVPRFAAVTDEARRAALLNAIAEGQVRVSVAVARHALSAGSPPAAYSQLSATLSGQTAAGDYLLSFGPVASGVGITARYLSSAALSTTGSAAFPQ